MKYLHYLCIFCTFLGQAQEGKDDKEDTAMLNQSNNLTWDGNQALAEDNFVGAEVDYRKAISKSDKNTVAPFNLGNAYYYNETYSEAFGRFKEAGENASAKNDKHKAYHNMGNVFMKRKEYQKAVEAYKEALRNNPTDDETRYNLALAKEMLEKEKQEQEQNDQNKDDQDKENEDNKDENEDKSEGDNNKDQEGDQEEDDKKDQEGDKGEEEKEDNKEGDGDPKEEQKKQPEQEGQPERQQPRPNQLSKQQVQNLLEAMQNEEKKVQEKIDAQKVQGVNVKTEKDW